TSSAMSIAPPPYSASPTTKSMMSSQRSASWSASRSARVTNASNAASDSSGTTSQATHGRSCSRSHTANMWATSADVSHGVSVTASSGMDNLLNLVQP